MKTTFFAVTRWAPEDIQTLRPDWNIDQCKDWLEENEGAIQDRVTELGWEVINCLLTIT